MLAEESSKRGEKETETQKLRMKKFIFSVLFVTNIFAKAQESCNSVEEKCPQGSKLLRTKKLHEELREKIEKIR